MFHFSRSHGLFDPLPLDLTILGGPILCPKETWCYFRFIFGRKLTLATHQLLHKQGFIDCKIYENAQKFVKRPHLHTKSTFIQKLCFTYYTA